MCPAKFAVGFLFDPINHQCESFPMAIAIPTVSHSQPFVSLDENTTSIWFVVDEFSLIEELTFEEHPLSEDALFVILKVVFWRFVEFKRAVFLVSS